MYFKLAWLNLWRNKRRTIIAMASVFYAVVLSIFMQSLQMGTMEQMVANVAGAYSGYIQVHQKGYWDDQSLDNSLTANDSLAKIIKATPGITETVPRVQSFALASGGVATKGIMLTGVEFEKEKNLTNLQPKIISGKYFNSDTESTVILSSGLADYLKLKVSDTLVLLGQGYHASSAAGKYKVSGIIKLGSPDLNKSMVFMPIKTAQTLLSEDGMLSAYALVVNDVTKVDQSLAYLNKHIDTSKYEIMGWKQMMPELDQAVQGKMASGAIIVGVLYMIVAFGIFGTVLMMANERMYEFGVLVAIGMNRKRLALVTILEALLISFLGVIAGYVASLGLIGYFVNNPIHMTGALAKSYEQFGLAPYIYTGFHLNIFLNQAIIIFVLSVLICLYPLLKISKLKPVEAMHGE